MNSTQDIKNTTDSNHIQFVFFGRLDKEKGWDLLLEVRHRLINEHKTGDNTIIENVTFLIFGDGDYREEILRLGALTHSIRYFGRKQRDEIQRYVGASDYTLMPSSFLETFGLTALESLSLGVPVVGFKKGGLVPFISDELAIDTYPGQTDADKLYNCIVYCTKNSSLEKKQQLCERASKISSKYSQEKRIQNFHQIIHSNHKQKTVLLATDYSSQLYGIESHVHSVKALLEEHGYMVELYGANVTKNKRNKRVRMLMLPMTIWNFWAAIAINKRVKELEPDIIRRHSTSRRLGRLPLRATRNYQGKQRMTYHDLGYFHPFPHQVEQTAQLPERNLKNYLKAGKSKNPIITLAMCCKFVLHSLLRKQLQRNIDKHFVPSTFMIPIVQKRLGTEAKGKVLVLEHYLRKS